MCSTVCQAVPVSQGHADCFPRPPPLPYLSSDHTPFTQLLEEDYRPSLRYQQDQTTARTLPEQSRAPYRVLPSRQWSARRRGGRHTPVSWSHQAVRHPALVKGHFHYSYAGNTLPERVVIPQFYDVTTLRRSHVRVSDELVPKPTEINIGKKQILVPVPREHPYQSHISRYALFPTFRSPDDPEAGVRAATRRPLNPIIATSAPNITVLSKTKGAAFRQEVSEVPMVTQRWSLLWPGQHGFYQYPKSVCAERQVFYPSLPKTVCPNPTLLSSQASLSLHTANMLHSLETSHWLSSYQLDYAGGGSCNLLQLDDLHEKAVESTTRERIPCTPTLRERHHPVLIPPRPQCGRKARLQQRRRPLESSYALGNQPSNDHHELTWPTASSDESPHCCDNRSDSQRVRTEAEGSRWEEALGQCVRFGCEEALGRCVRFGCEEALGQCVRLGCEVCGAEERDCHCQKPNTEPGAEPGSEPQGSSLRVGVQGQGSKAWLDGLRAEQGSEERGAEGQGEYQGLQRSQSCLHTPYLSEGAEDTPEGRQDRQDRSLWRSHSALLEADTHTHSHSALLDLQDSFSRADAHRRIRHTLRMATFDLRENLPAGRRHIFYGYNAFYFHN